MSASTIMHTHRSQSVRLRLSAVASLLLGIAMLPGCNQVETAGCGPIAKSLRPVDSQVYTVRLGSMAADAQEPCVDGPEPRPLSSPRSTRAFD